jgi:hypothetical protein
MGVRPVCTPCMLAASSVPSGLSAPAPLIPSCLPSMLPGCPVGLHRAVQDAGSPLHVGHLFLYFFEFKVSLPLRHSTNETAAATLLFRLE